MLIFLLVQRLKCTIRAGNIAKYIEHFTSRIFANDDNTSHSTSETADNNPVCWKAQSVTTSEGAIVLVMQLLE